MDRGPIRQLTRHNAKWVWGSVQQHAFVYLKTRMATSEIMKYFNPSLETELIVDASLVGLGAILTQVAADKGMNVVAYASRSRSPPDCERRYSQLKEKLLLWFGESNISTCIFTGHPSQSAQTTSRWR